MTEQFFEPPILNTPYDYPAQHRELDAGGQPTSQITEARRRSELITVAGNEAVIRERFVPRRTDSGFSQDS